MKFNSKLTSKALFTIVGGAVLINPVYAQEQEQSGEELDTVVVTGLRGSLKASLETKRDALGVVDSINSEDIGKFPDTNLAESLQRITGISIDRRNGEGAQVTARGFGPQFNLITLNGRQLPSADAFGGGDAVTGGQGAAGRSFNFANLASEAVSAVEVYKTARADIASGGIGATVNIKTARPLDNDGTVFNAGFKGMYDESAPFGNSVTPEVSGIFSFANDSKSFGVGLNATYSKRKSGGVESTVNDWVIRSWDSGELPGAFNDDTVIENAPAEGQLYGIPNDVRYAFSAFERERINSQAVVQFAPTDAFTVTLDYTMARNEIKQDRGEQTMWAQQGSTFDEVHFDTGHAVATPIYIFEMTAGATGVDGSGYSNKDFGFEQQHNEQLNELDSLGVNLDWQVTDRFSLSFDGHSSEGRSSPNDGITGGSQTAFSFAGVPMCAGLGEDVGRIPTPPAEGSNPDLPNPPPCAGFTVQEYNFSGDLPQATRIFFADQASAQARLNGNSNYVFDGNHIGSQVMRINYQQMDSQIKQYRLDGKFELNENNRFSFGVEQRDMDWHQRSSNNQMAMGNWGAVDAGTTRGQSLASVLTPYNLVGLFDDYNAGTASTNAYRANASHLAQWAFANGYTNWDDGSGPDGLLTYNHTWGNDNYVKEEVKAAYLQYALKGDLGAMPFNLALGYRIEDTDVTSTSFIALPIAVRWDQNNDFSIIRSSTISPVTESASYDNALPALDFDIGLTDSLKARASWGKTIARANIGNLAAGATPGGPSGSTLINEAARGGGNRNNPTLVPLESTNIDVSLEWYFNDTGYISAGYWKKDVKNFIGNSIVQETLFGLTNPTEGPDAQAARDFLVAENISVNDTSLFIATALERFETLTRPAFNAALSDLQNTEQRFNIDGSAEDPLYVFNVNVPFNQEEAGIDGWEIGGQYFFGESGFGVLANYTIVNGDVSFDDTGPTNQNQFALLGLSDTANAVLMYEKFGFTARLAWNWRDEFLLSANNGGSRNPRYVEAYQQIDLSVGYDVSDNLSVSFDAINLTGEDIRWHGRSENQMIRLEDQTPRYAVGARYKF